MSILTEPRKPNEPVMWLRDMTEEDFIAVARERFIREVECGMHKAEASGDDNSLPK